MPGDAAIAVAGGLLFVLLFTLLRRTSWRRQWKFDARAPVGRWFIGVCVIVAFVTLLIAILSMREGASTRDVLSALMSLLLLTYVVMLVGRGSQRR